MMARLSPKVRRGVGIGVMVAMVGFGVLLILTALEDHVVYFYGPSEIVSGEGLGDISSGRRIRVGGLVVEGSIIHAERSVNFAVSDGGAEIIVRYEGVLPDLFREGQGVVAEGYFDGEAFMAEIILAKHDETYMPKEVADLLKERGLWQEGQN